MDVDARMGGRMDGWMQAYRYLLIFINGEGIASFISSDA